MGDPNNPGLQINQGTNGTFVMSFQGSGGDTYVYIHNMVGYVYYDQGPAPP